MVKNGASKVEPAPVSRTVLVPAAEACSVLGVPAADVHAVSAAVMASTAAAASAAAVRGGLPVWVRGRAGVASVPSWW